MPSKVNTTEPMGAFPESDFKYTPLQHVQTLYAAFLQGLFGTAPPGQYHWEEDPQASEIIVSNETPIHTDTIGVRPAIALTMGPVQFYSLGLDDMMTYDFATGTKQKSVLVPGTMSINCCSRNAIESRNLAWVVAEHFWLLRELLMRQGFFEIGRQPVIGAPSPPGAIIAGDGADEFFATTVTSPFQFYRTSQFTPLNQRILDGMGNILRTRLEKVNSGNWPFTFSPEWPYAIERRMPSSFAPDATDAQGGTPNPGGSTPRLPLVPHPLNPAQMVVLRPARSNRPGIRPPSIGGRAIPLSKPCVEESMPEVADVRTVKV